jgi:uncharacterized protein
MTEMVEVVIDSIRVSLISQQRIVILKELETERYLPIWIGVYEAEAIALALQEVEVSRPLTHDLLKNVFKALDARVVRVEVITLRDDTFYGNIVTEVNGRTLDIDSRPSDALALAVRAHVPILVTRSIMDSAGIIPEENLQEQESPPEPVEGGEERLSVFEDFLDKLDIEDVGKEEQNGEDENEEED